MAAPDILRPGEPDVMAVTYYAAHIAKTGHQLPQEEAIRWAANLADQSGMLTPGVDHAETAEMVIKLVCKPPEEGAQ